MCPLEEDDEIQEEEKHEEPVNDYDERDIEDICRDLQRKEHEKQN